MGYDEKYYVFNDPQSYGPLTYYTKEAVETAYAAQGRQAVVLLRRPEEPEEPENLPYETIQNAKKVKYVKILNALDVPGDRINEGKFGLFREIDEDVTVSELVGNIWVTYSCGKTTKLSTPYDTNYTINVVNGNLDISDGERSNVTFDIDKMMAHYNLENQVSPFIN